MSTKLEKKYKEAVANWTRSNNFTLWGTCLFNFESLRDDADKKKAIRRFFNALDRHIYTAKEIAKEGKRVERLVFVEQGRSRTFLHWHFYCKAENAKQLKKIINFTQKFWHEKTEDTQKLELNTNSYGDERSGYAIKEFRETDNEQIFVECCYLKHE
ncbi:hypothetical protein [Cypionkella sp.]|uniref:hypothetical protein n=1 Tax=Cypionkella sp. TaxID=2811411 RepID=UPI003753BA2F